MDVRSVTGLRSLIFVLAIWSAIYLPGLGTLEIKGEEGRRILPAVTMLQTGNYLVPHVGSEPYFRKPPLVNWLVAASFKILGKRNEWTARLPSALCVLAVAIAFVTTARRCLGANGSLIGALVWMTNFGMIEKGRLIEIEALYASLCGLAIICWLSAWQERRSSWITWTVPWIFLGLGLLAKGPVLLVFFYAIVFSVLYRCGELRSMVNVAHLVGLLIMIAIFAAWAVPCLLIMRDSGVAHVWSRQFSGRLSGEDFKLGGWLMNVPRGLGYFLPWILLLFAIRKRPTLNVQRSTSNEGSRSSTLDVERWTLDVSFGLLWGILLSFLLISLLPGSLARYTMPLLAPASWLMALLLSSERFELPQWLKLKSPSGLRPQLRLPAIVVLLVCVAMLLYAFAVMPLLQRREKVRTIAAQINAALPAGEPLYAVDPDYQPFLFYVRDPIVYVDQINDVPASGRYLLVQPDKEQQVIDTAQWRPLRARQALRLKDYRNKEVTLFEVGERP